MKMSKYILAFLISLTSLAEIHASEILTDVYDFRMSLRVPRVYNNNESLGYRKYQIQTIKGKLKIKYYKDELPCIEVVELENRTQKLSNGSKITYKCVVDENQMLTRVNFIGNNKTDVFKTPSVCFYLVAEPNYNKGLNDEDNSLYVSLSGSGSSKKIDGCTVIKYLRGSVSGTLGCGCTAYGHISPTRVVGPCGATDIVDDVAVVYGTWMATLNKTESVCR